VQPPHRPTKHLLLPAADVAANGDVALTNQHTILHHPAIRVHYSTKQAKSCRHPQASTTKRHTAPQQQQQQRRRVDLPTFASKLAPHVGMSSPQHAVCICGYCSLLLQLPKLAEPAASTWPAEQYTGAAPAAFMHTPPQTQQAADGTSPYLSNTSPQLTQQATSLWRQAPHTHKQKQALEHHILSCLLTSHVGTHRAPPQALLPVAAGSNPTLNKHRATDRPMQPPACQRPPPACAMCSRAASCTSSRPSGPSITLSPPCISTSTSP